MKDKYVLEYSHSQNCFHVHSLNDMIETNAKNFLQGNKTDFVPIYIGKESDVRQLCNNLQKTRNEKEFSTLH
jgi:hypothetical protein